MNNEDVLPYYTASSSCSMGVFSTSMGDLQRHLYKGGEYDMFKYAPVFESNFIQISKKGEVIDVHKRFQMVTVGIASTSPVLPLPDVMLVARPARVYGNHKGYSRPTKRRGRKATETLELTRLLPLKFVRISLHDREKQQLRLKLATGRTFYLQLCPSSDAHQELFCCWEKLVLLLRPRMESSTQSIQTGDLTNTSVCLTDDNKNTVTADLCGEGDWDEGRLYKFQEVSGATSSAYAGGERIRIQPSRGMPGTSSTALNSPGSAKRAAVTEVAAGPTQGAAVAGSVEGLSMGAAIAGVVAGSTAGATTARSTASSTMGAAVAGTTAGHSESTISIAITKASGSAQSNVALAGVVTKSPRVSRRPSKAIAGTASVPAESANMVLESATSSSAEGSSTQSTVATSYSPGSSMNMVFEGVTTSRLTAENAELPLLLTLKSEGYMSERAGRQRVSKPNTEVEKEKRGRRSKRDKNPPRRSSHHHRKGRDNSHHRRKGGDKSSRKSSSHRSLANCGTRREDKKEKSHSSTKGRRQGASFQKSISHSPTSEETRTTQKLGRTQSAASSSASVGKESSRISSFFRSFRATPASRAAITSRERELDIVAKTVERRTIESNLETAREHVQDVEITGTLTSETTETILASKAT
ncbi:PREDICTED: protein FAM71B-like [Elephantulus edwardii]|uniref:protein FAM71B-like n=1 Tax=Elephantulus edwardii TaxID=28737 RepID=UPI0003F08A81|nr:PREDICTED: protein FAM71B-like [Elephantulus edwardii]